MFNSTKQIEKSRLGRLLVNRGYIDEIQLDDALRIQRETGDKLGEVLIRSGLLTAAELKRTLKRQSRYRYTAAFVAVVVSPLQPLVAFAASPTAQAHNNTNVSGQVVDRELKGLVPLDEFEMSSISAQGLTDEFQSRFQNLAALVDSDPDTEFDDDGLGGAAVVRDLTKAAFPLSNVLDADVEITGVRFAEDAQARITNEGGVQLPLPAQIEEISIQNIRVAGSNSGSFGDLFIRDVRFTPDSSITIRPLP